MWRSMGFFYSENWLIWSRDLEWPQGELDAFIGLLFRFVLMTNVAKYKKMTCQSGNIWSGMSEEAVGWRSTGRGATYREMLRWQITWLDCGVELMAGLMTVHRRRHNGKEPPINWNRLPVSQAEHLPQMFEVSLPKVTAKWKCAFTGFPGSSCTWSGLRNHFNQQNWGDSLIILEENPSPLPHYERCECQGPPRTLKTDTTQQKSASSERNNGREGIHCKTVSRWARWLSEST